jgi:hypothetical protein
MNINFKKLFVTVAGVALTLAAQTVTAFQGLHTCSDPVYGVNGTGGYGTYYTSGNCVNGHTSNVSSTLVTSPLVLRAAASNVNNLIMTRIQHLRKPEASAQYASKSQPFGTGFSSGNHNDGWNFWMNGYYNDVENTYGETAFDGHIGTVMVGLDTLVTSWNTLFGLSIGWEDQDLDTYFNNGSQEGNGWSITPYANFMFHKNWSLSLLFGFASMDYDLTRRDPSVGSLFSGSADADRYYGSIDLLYHEQWDNWRVNGQMGFFYVKEERDAYTETGAQSVAQAEYDAKLGQFRLGGSAGYLYDGQYEPYLRAMFLWDFSQEDINVAPIQGRPSNDDTGIIFGAGMNIFVVDNVAVNLDAHTEFTRDDYKGWGAGATILINFG